ncbi:MAG TPA: hypothetical protein VF950_27460 [Planctomycetota bacterium]
MDVQLEHEYFFNPDGSGKVKVRWSGPAGGPDIDPRKFIGEEVGQAKGVDAWSDVSYGPEEDRAVFRGTAYFRNVSELRFHCQGMHVNSTDFATATDPKGGFTVVGRIETKSDAPVAVAKLPEAIAEARAQMEMGREFIEGMFDGLRCTCVLRLPGKIKTPKNAKKVDDTSVSTEMKGRDLLDIIDRLMKDDALMGEMLKRGGGPDAIASLLGDLGPAEVSTKGKTAPLFDYESEVAAAAAAFEEFRASLGVPAGPERAKPAENTRVVAVKLVREADGENDFNPMGQNYAGLSIIVAGDLPGPALKVEEGRVEAFILDDGTDLTPADDWDRRIHFPKLTKDGRTVYCEVEVKQLPEAAGIREIRGVVRVQVATATEEVDLGFPELATGAQGSMFNAALERCETGEDGRTSIEVRLDLAMERIQSLAIVDENGSAAELNRGGYSASGDQCTLTLDSDAALVPGMKLKARVMADIKYYEVPFAVENVDLLGRPRTP